MALVKKTLAAMKSGAFRQPLWTVTKKYSEVRVPVIWYMYTHERNMHV